MVGHAGLHGGNWDAPNVKVNVIRIVEAWEEAKARSKVYKGALRPQKAAPSDFRAMAEAADRDELEN